MGKRWTEEEQILALNLYFKLPFGQQHSNNEKVIELAGLLDRTPGSINMKLNNYAALDPTLDREGLSNTSDKDEKIWNQFWNNLSELGATSEYLLEEFSNNDSTQTQEKSIGKQLKEMSEQFGTETSGESRRRHGQRFFRRVVLSNYGYQCCVCRLSQRKLLEAAHIQDWSKTDDSNTRMDPQNGLAMCRIHHTAFDRQLIEINPSNFTVEISEKILEEHSPGAEAIFHKFDGVEMFVPEKFRPDRKYFK